MKTAPLLAALLLSCSSHVLGHESKPVGTVVTLMAEASRSTDNDLFRATAYAEASDSNSASLARQVNLAITQGLALAKNYPDVKVKTGSSYTTPIYGKTQRSIESWRMRSDIQLESRNAASMTELLGKLQSQLAISNLSAQPSPETASKAEADATVAAISQFKERAGLIASTLGKKYKIVEMNIGNSGRAVQYSPMRNRAVMAAASDAPMPIEAGESLTSVMINGKIELSE